MAYDIAYRGLDGQSGLYCRVQRPYDEKWWDESASEWVDAADADCNVTLTEGSTAGVYAASAGFTAAKGGLYKIHVYDSDDELVAISEVFYTPDQTTALGMIQNVQKELRLPQASAVSESHAALILAFLNKTQMDFMMEGFTWDQLRIRGAFATREDISLYYIYPANGGIVDGIVKDTLRIGNNEPLTLYSDKEFINQKRQNTTPGQPWFYRIYARAGAALIIEVGPDPDDIYQVDFEALQRPAKMTSATDIPLLDPDIIQAGALFLAKEDQGDDYTAAFNAFQVKLGLQGGTQQGQNNDDLVPV